MCLEKALSALPPADRLQVEDGLLRLARISGLTFQAVQNFQIESRLARECWASLLKNLSASTSAGSTCAAVTSILQLYTLSGPPVSLPDKRRLGRAISLQKFCNLLVDLGHYGAISSAHCAVRNMLNKPLLVLRKNWRHIPLGRYLMWSTFNPEDDIEHPFKGMDGSADEIRGILGLDRNEAGSPLLLFEYEVPEHTAVRFPTVAEAYSGGAWPYFFRPAPKGSPYGITMPWPEFESRQPRPEVVHEVIDMGYVVAPIRKMNEPTAH